MSDGKPVWNIGVSVFGVMKRGRNAKWHRESRIEKYLEIKPSDEEAKRVAQGWIDAHMKSYQKAVATLTRVYIDGVMEHWEPFTEEDNLKISLEVVGHGNA